MEAKELLHLILLNNMSTQCKKELCAHYIGKDRFHLYRHTFIWIIVIASVLAVGVFVCVVLSFNNSHKNIVQTNAESIAKIETQLELAHISNDNSFYADEYVVSSIRESMASIESLLNLELSRIQSDYAILSLWAGVLMIIFLVFSIYSMFKTDEVLKQSKIGLETVEKAEERANESVSRVEDKANVEIQKVSTMAQQEYDEIIKKTQETISDVKKEIKTIKESFDQDVTKKNEELTQLYEAMKEQIENAKKDILEINAEQKDEFNDKSQDDNHQEDSQE